MNATKVTTNGNVFKSRRSNLSQLSNTPLDHVESHDQPFIEEEDRSVTQSGHSNGVEGKDPEKGVPFADYPNDIVTFDGPDDPDNPQNFPFRTKAVITFLLGMTTCGAQFGSAVLTSSSKEIMEEFDVSEEVFILTTSLFILGYVFGPIVFAPISETWGRKISVYPPYFIYICFTAGSGAAKDIQTLLITRFFGGLFASAPISNVGGGLADIWSIKTRAVAVSLYAFAVVGGPTLGPIVGAAVSPSETFGWRWTMWFTVILCSVILFLSLIFVPETFAPVILTRKASRLRHATGRWALHSKHETSDFSLKSFLEKHLFRPFLFLFTEPIILALCTYLAFTYSLLYIFFVSFPITFQEKRGWSPLVGSLPFLAVMIGAITGGLCNLTYASKVYSKVLDRNGGKPVPEMRLPLMILGSVTFPVGLYWFAWTSDPNIIWVPQIFSIWLIGMSFILIFQTGLNYAMDAYAKYSASAIATITFTRSIFAAAFPLFTVPMYNRLGVAWATTLLAILGTVFAFVPLVFFYKGKWLRSISKYASADDNKFN